MTNPTRPDGDVEEVVRCDACLADIPAKDARTDDDGFTGCRPCFPLSNWPEDGNRFLRGRCHRPRAALEGSSRG